MLYLGFCRRCRSGWVFAFHDNFSARNGADIKNEILISIKWRARLVERWQMDIGHTEINGPWWWIFGSGYFGFSFDESCGPSVMQTQMVQVPDWVGRSDRLTWSAFLIVFELTCFRDLLLTLEIRIGSLWSISYTYFESRLLRKCLNSKNSNPSSSASSVQILA